MSLSKKNIFGLVDFVRQLYTGQLEVNKLKTWRRVQLKKR